MSESRTLLLKKLKEHLANFERRFRRPMLVGDEKDVLAAVVRNLRKVLAGQDGFLPSV